MSKLWTKWPADRKIAAIQKVWVLNYSADQIAELINKEFKLEVTRNAVIGFYNRVSTNAKRNKGINPLRDYPLNRPSVTPANLVAARAKKKRLFEQRQGDKVVVIEADPDWVDNTLEYYGVPMITMIKSDGCRWPTNVSSRGYHLFCNHSRTRPSMYCARHQTKSRQRSNDQDRPELEAGPQQVVA